MTKPKCHVSQTGLSSFGSSNFTASFIKFQNRLFTPPPSRWHQGTFNQTVKLQGLKHNFRKKISGVFAKLQGSGYFPELNELFFY
jgi:hypothetical protein